MTAAVLQMQQNWGSSMSPPRPQKQVKIAKGNLATLAPRYRAWIDGAFATAETTSNKAVNLPRTRLPPRSRFGCWTCRTRKVKCDEARPECTPCSRLGHNCDYNPRLSFKDDTGRVVEKMSGTAGAPGPVWNPQLVKRRRLNPSHDDLLPPFASLTNDEDRERKAEFRKPGTYQVIVNPATFADYDEYREKGDDEFGINATLSRNYSNSRRITNDPYANNPIQSAGRPADGTPILDDPDIVVLKVFEDDSRRITPSPSGLCMIRSRSSRASTFSNSSTFSISASIAMAHQHRSPSMFAYDDSPLMRVANSNGQDHQIIYFYKNFVQRHLLQVHRDTLGTPLETGSVSSADVFERQAATFLPLYHALMAFCALSMSQKQGNAQSLFATALQHYQQTLPSLQASLRTESDLASDGVFLTHFILLLYEIAAGEAYGMSLWQQHISQLLRIILLRRNMYRREPYSFILWWVANIDTHALLSGMGNGRFVETMLQQNLLPSGLEADDYHQPATSISAATPTHSGIPDPLFTSLPSALAFHRRICTLAAQLGLLARDLRAEEQRDPANCNSAALAARRRRVADFQGLLQRTWDAQTPIALSGGYSNLVVPIGARGLYEHSFALHRALTIYAHTSLPRSSLPTSSPSLPSSSPPSSTPAFANSAIRAASNDILLLAHDIVASAHYERKFIVFPLFMAGCVASSAREREEVRSLLRWLDEDSVGRNGVAARELLEEVYARQGQTGEDEEEGDKVVLVSGEGERATGARGGGAGGGDLSLGLGLGLGLGLDLGLDLDLGLGLGMGVADGWTQPPHPHTQNPNQRHQNWASGSGAGEERRDSQPRNERHHQHQRRREQEVKSEDEEERKSPLGTRACVYVDWLRLMRELGLQTVNCRL